MWTSIYSYFLLLLLCRWTIGCTLFLLICETFSDT